MADDADRAEDRIEATIADGISHARRMLVKSRLAPCNACHYCGEWLKDGQLFCDTLCAADYQYEQERKKAQGLR